MERVHHIASSEDNIEGCQKKARLMSSAPCKALPVLGVQGEGEVGREGGKEEEGRRKGGGREEGRGKGGRAKSSERVVNAQR